MSPFDYLIHLFYFCGVLLVICLVRNDIIKEIKKEIKKERDK